MHSCIAGDRAVRAKKNLLWDVDARVTGIDDLLTRQEAQYLIDAADKSGTCQRSKVVGGNANITSSVRTSTTCFLEKGGDEVLRCIEDKIAHVAGRPVDHLEPLQLTRYTTGQQYKPHFDFFTAGHNPGDRQRTTTVFAYLQGIETDCGGATVFSELKAGTVPLRVKPVTGTAVMWENLNADGTGNTMTRHGGEPVTCDGVEKIGLNAWFGDRAWT
jgi:prolyl 4-hydroxylase